MIKSKEPIKLYFTIRMNYFSFKYKLIEIFLCNSRICNREMFTYGFSIADDHSRVKLIGLPAGHTDYINANYIDVSVI